MDWSKFRCNLLSKILCLSIQIKKSWVKFGYMAHLPETLHQQLKDISFRFRKFIILWYIDLKLAIKFHNLWRPPIPPLLNKKQLALKALFFFSGTNDWLYVFKCMRSKKTKHLAMHHDACMWIKNKKIHKVQFNHS